VVVVDDVIVGGSGNVDVGDFKSGIGEYSHAGIVEAGSSGRISGIGDNPVSIFVVVAA
jgi:hypothetical protein